MDSKVRARDYVSVVEDFQCSEFESQYSETKKQKCIFKSEIVSLDISYGLNFPWVHAWNVISCVWAKLNVIST